jgi:hypothetical protein
LVNSGRSEGVIHRIGRQISHQDKLGDPVMTPFKWIGGASGAK